MALTEQSGNDRLHAIRATYARQVCASAGIAPGSGIEAALSAIPRESFMGPPPWRIVSGRGHTRGAVWDPADLYQDVLISLGGEPGLNNGQPSLHAMCINALALEIG